MRGMPTMVYFLFVVVAFSPSWVRWAISAICVPRIIYRITARRLAAFFAVDLLMQIVVVFFYPVFLNEAVCRPAISNDGWCFIMQATKAVAIWEGIFSLLWIGAAVIRRRRR